MKIAVLAGGHGTRLAEETVVRPKPMVEIGGQPILWHILMHYSHYNFEDFVIALGYKGEYIKRHFLDYRLLSGSFAVSLSDGAVTMVDRASEDWKVHLIDTGVETQTGGRVKRLRPYIGAEPFMMTYGDAVADIDLGKLVAFHRSHGKLATVTAVRPPSRFGGLTFDGDSVVLFNEKPQIGEGWINGGFFVLQPDVMDYIDGDDITFEREPMERLAGDGQLMGYRHYSFWQPMDVLREVRILRRMWDSGSAPWKMWEGV